MRIGFLADVSVGERTAAADLVHDDRFEHAVFRPDFLDDPRGLVVAAAGRGEHHEFDGALRFPGLRRGSGHADRSSHAHGQRHASGEGSESNDELV